MPDSKKLLTRAGAVTKNEIILAGALEDWETYFPLTRMYRHRHGHPEKLWRHLDFEFHTASICAYLDSKVSSKEPYYVALSSEGEVYHHGLTEGYIERIKGSGISHEDSKCYGRMTSIRQIGDKLYACGEGGQLYVRHGRDNWEFLTQDLLWDPEKFAYDADDMPDEDKDPEAYDAWEKAYDETQKNNPSYILYDLNGPSENEIYICGEDGLLYMWDGQTLEDLDQEIEGALTNIHVADNGIVWICGHEGLLLSGNEEDGFDDHSDEENEQLFTSITTYQDRVILASHVSPTSLFEFNKDTEEFISIKPDIDRPLDTLYHVQAIDDVLWVVGTKDILRLKDEKWERVEHPDIPNS